jgi:hypothetical protein
MFSWLWWNARKGRSAYEAYRPAIELLEGRSVPSFIVAGSYPAGVGAIAVAVGDFNSDGTADLAVANYQPNTVSILLGNGDGSFQAPVSYAVGTNPHSVVVGDFNGDGNLDLAVANDTFGGTVSVLLGNGDGTFQEAVNYGIDKPYPLSLAVADLNGDGIDDLAVTTSGTVSVLLGNGDGSFQKAIDTAVGGGVARLAVGDFNGDGIADVAVTITNGGGSVKILLGNGDGHFQVAKSYPTGDFPVAIASADFNGDGILDLATADYGNSLNFSTVSLLLGNGDGSFQAPIQYQVGIEADAVVAGDWNGDGLPDLAVANDYSGTVSVLLGQGDGTFQEAENYGVGARPEDLAVGDFNGDGSTDLVTADYQSYTATVLLNANDWQPGHLSSPAAIEPPPIHGLILDATLGQGMMDRRKTRSQLLPTLIDPGLERASSSTVGSSLGQSPARKAASPPKALGTWYPLDADLREWSDSESWRWT